MMNRVQIPGTNHFMNRPMIKKPKNMINTENNYYLLRGQEFRIVPLLEMFKKISEVETK